MEAEAQDEGARANRAHTIASYEEAAVEYARETASDDRVLSSGLDQLVRAVPGGEVLEVGSGPGWDADALERSGLSVRRTDVTRAFIDLQRERGRTIDHLDVVTDHLDGPYDGVVALHVLQHVEVDELRVVLGKVARALRPDGRFLVSMPLGEGTEWEVGESGRRYFRTLWREDTFTVELATAGLEPVWSEQTDGWVCLLAGPRRR